LTNSKSWYPVPKCAMILSAIPIIKCYHLWQKLVLSCCTSIREKFGWANQSASNSLTLRSRKKKKKKKKKNTRPQQ
ncbi:unnamed protein product, partial [Pocillopora meandrina]